MYKYAVESGNEELAISIIGLRGRKQADYDKLVEATRYEAKINKNWDQIFHTALTKLYWDEESNAQKKELLSKPLKYQRVLKQLVWPEDQTPIHTQRIKAWEAVCNWPKNKPTSRTLEMHWLVQAAMLSEEDSLIKALGLRIQDSSVKSHMSTKPDSLIEPLWEANRNKWESKKPLSNESYSVKFNPTQNEYIAINKKLYEFSLVVLEAVKRAGTIREFRELIRNDLEAFDIYWSQHKFLVIPLSR